MKGNGRQRRSTKPASLLGEEGGQSQAGGRRQLSFHPELGEGKKTLQEFIPWNPAKPSAPCRLKLWCQQENLRVKQLGELLSPSCSECCPRGPRQMKPPQQGRGTDGPKASSPNVRTVCSPDESLGGLFVHLTKEGLRFAIARATLPSPPSHSQPGLLVIYLFFPNCLTFSPSSED